MILLFKHYHFYYQNLWYIQYFVNYILQYIRFRTIVFIYIIYIIYNEGQETLSEDTKWNVVYAKKKSKSWTVGHKVTMRNLSKTEDVVHRAILQWSYLLDLENYNTSGRNMIKKSYVKKLEERIKYLDKICTRLTFTIVKQNSELTRLRRMIKWFVLRQQNIVTYVLIFITVKKSKNITRIIL